MDPVEVVQRFLESVGRRSEADFYLNLFRAEPKEQFAVISVDANVARHATEAVVLHLRFLAGLGLFPVVVLGLFEPTDALEHAARIRRRLERAGVPATLLPGGDPGLDALASQTIKTGTLPIIAYGTNEGATPEDRFNRLGGLLSTLQTRKLLFLHRPGGLKQGGVLVPIVNLNTEYTTMLASKELSRKERALLIQSRRLIFDLVPHKLVIAITSPLNLLRELFTVKGAGTLLRRGGVIERRNALEGVDRDRLRALLTSSFGRAPYETFFDRAFDRVYLEKDYRGAAIMEATPIGSYLTKFAVGREAQGEGLGRDLWDAFIADCPVVFWRARSSNPILDWYTKLSDGLFRTPEWTVFWKGLEPDRIPDAIRFALAQPVDMPPAQTAA
jgi:acetylglutamate kinase